MNKALLMQLWVFVIGFLVCNLHKRTFDPAFRTLIALPIGWALFGICATIVYSVYFSAASQIVLLVVLALTTLALLLANITQGALSRDSILLDKASLVILTGVCFFVDLLRIITMTPDSSYIVRFRQNIGLGNYEASRRVFSMWGPLVPFIHSITNLLDQKLYWQFQPLLSLDLVAIVFYTVYTIIREQQSILQSFVAVTVLVSFMALSNIFLFHVFYIHVNIISALYMYLFVFALVKMQQQPGRAYELLALLSLIAFSLVRLEAPLFVIVILLVTTFRQGWSYVTRLKLIIPFVVLFVAWYARVYFILPEVPSPFPSATDLLTKELVVAVISVLVGFGLFAVVTGLKVLDPIVKRTPFLTLMALVLASVTFTTIKSEHMLTSLKSIVQNILVYGNWGLTWYVMFFLATERYFARIHAPTERHWMFMVLVTYILLAYNLAYFTDSYHIGAVDSANRLVLQALPLVLLYLSTLQVRMF
ncbi:MAG TPA: hypothetical protein VFQ43_15210 [Nitrososphaera sp.]|nr:hypothetical protein [Nitrososphaera sp.]